MFNRRENLFCSYISRPIIGLYPGSAVEGMKRLNGIIGMSPDPNESFFNLDLEMYGLGKVRPRDKFFKLYGIHTDT